MLSTLMKRWIRDEKDLNLCFEETIHLLMQHTLPVDVQHEVKRLQQIHNAVLEQIHKSKEMVAGDKSDSPGPMQLDWNIEKFIDDTRAKYSKGLYLAANDLQSLQKDQLAVKEALRACIEDKQNIHDNISHIREMFDIYEKLDCGFKGLVTNIKDIGTRMSAKKSLNEEIGELIHQYCWDVERFERLTEMHIKLLDKTLGSRRDDWNWLCDQQIALQTVSDLMETFSGPNRAPRTRGCCCQKCGVSLNFTKCYCRCHCVSSNAGGLHSGIKPLPRHRR